MKNKEDCSMNENTLSRSRLRQLHKETPAAASGILLIEYLPACSLQRCKSELLSSMHPMTLAYASRQHVYTKKTDPRGRICLSQKLE